MKQEDKDLLLKDLCARLPYEVKCNVGEEMPYTLSRIEVDNVNGHLLDFIETKDGLDMQVYLSEVKPYLFPLSSMTEEQRKEFILYSDYSVRIEGCGKLAEEYHYELVVYKNQLRPNYKDIDWLNAHHFDYRGLIEKDLAIDATGKNIY